MKLTVIKNIIKKIGQKNHLLSIAIYTLITVSQGCKKYVEVEAPINQVINNEVFASDQTATAAVVGLYSQMMATTLYLINGGLTVYCGLSADEISNVNSSTTYDPFLNNALANNNSIVQTAFWRYGYSYIYQANACIDGLNNSTGVSASTKSQLLGEMKFSRALCYFYLVNLFGDVPLETSTDYHLNELKGRTAKSAVYQQILADLQDAQNLLPAASGTSAVGRPNKYAALALLARVNLYQGDWKNAVTNSTSVIGSGSYSLVTNLNNVFLAGSSEAVWSLIPVNTYNTAEGATFVPSSATVKPTFTLTKYLLNSFETGDQRKIAWLKSGIVSGVTYVYPYKYKVRTGTSKTEYNIILRLAEQYLIRAEANAQQGNIAAAVNDVNIIRSRAGLAPLPITISQQACLNAIAQENRIEFFVEMGHRWLDLKRLGQADNVLGSEKTNWKSNASLFPIPYNETVLNPNLVQNPGY